MQQQRPGAGDMRSAGGGTRRRSGRHIVSSTVGGPQPSWRYQGPRERTDAQRNAEASPRGFIRMRRNVDSGNQPSLYHTYINIYKIIPWCHGLWSGVFCLGLSMRFAELDFSVEHGLVRAPPSGGGSNAPRPAVSVPHIDVNADGRRARRASVEEEFWKNC